MTMASTATPTGQCDCGYIRYRLRNTPLIVHCCHCSWCQRETGSGFALNAMIESSELELLSGTPLLIDTPSNSGKGQQIARCPHCYVALWSHYAGSGPCVSFVRVGTLQHPETFPPDVHIFTASKQPWLQLPAATPAFTEYYDRQQIWPKASLARYAALLPQINAWRNRTTAS